MTNGGLERSGLRLVAEGSAEFNRALTQANRALAGFHSGILKALAPMSALGQVATGALREIGAFVTRGLVGAGREALRFAENLVQASLKGTAFEQTTKDLYASLVQVTRTSLEPFFDSLGQAAERAAPKLLAIAQVAGEHLGGLGQSALAWGQNVAVSFANGIVNGIVAVIDALTQLGNIIAYWLTPGSPPRLLPDLDKWGAGAASAWVAGWSKADFGTFNELAGTIEAALRSTSRGKDEGLIPAILGSRSAIAEAVEMVRQTGQVTQATLDNIFAAIGPATQAMRDYVAATLRLEVANKAVRDLETQFQSLNDAQTALINEGTISQLELVAGDPNATAREKEIARLEIEKLRTGGALTAAQREQAAAQAVFDTAQARVQMETETNNLLRDQANLMDSLVAKVDDLVKKLAAGAGAGAGGGLARFLPDLAFMDKINEKIELIKGKLTELRTAWENAWGAFNERMQPVYDFINNEVIPLFIRLKVIAIGQATIALTQLRNFWTDTFLPDLKEFKTWADENLVPVFQRLWAAIVVLLPAIVLAAGVGINLILIPALQGVYDILTTFVLPALGNLWILFFTLLPVAVSLVAVEVNILKNRLKTLWTWLGNLGTKLDDLIPKFATNENLFKGMGLAADIAKDAVGRVVGALSSLWTWLQKTFTLKVDIPDIVTPGSPTPFEIGLRGIKQAMVEVNNLALAPRVSPPASAAQIVNQSTSHSYTHAPVLHYAPNYNTPARGPAQDFTIMQTLFGSAPG